MNIGSTPLTLVRDIISSLNIDESDSILDPFYRQGEFFHEFRNKFAFFTEIEMGLDFFDHNKRVDWIISNPPLNGIERILEKSADLCIKGFGYILFFNELNANIVDNLEKRGFFITKLSIININSWNHNYSLCFVLWEKNKKSKDINFLKNIFF